MSTTHRSKSRLFPQPVKGTQRLFRYPILIIVIIVVIIELLAYFILRTGVILYEFLLIFFRCRSQAKKLWISLREAPNYQDYILTAKELDIIFRKNKWKSKNESWCYDISLVSSNLNTLKTYQKNQNYIKLSESLIEIFSHSLKWFEEEELYTYTHYGTKYIVSEYINCVEESIKLIKNCSNRIISSSDKLKIFCRLQQEFGRTCLCLSGGATMTFYQFGVIRTLFLNGLLPQIICGTSGGSLVGSLICTRTDEELNTFLTPNMYKHMNAADEPVLVRLKRLLFTGHMFNWEDWKKKLIPITYGLTFLEAFEKTGRIFNVTAISINHSPVLLNYKTTPNVCIWSAVIASSSLPLCMAPSPLIEKIYNNNNFTLKEFKQYGKLFQDGSIQFDIPKQRLLEDFNVKYTICVQCNMHVFIFYFNGRGTANNPISHLGTSGMRGGFLSSFLEKILKLELRKWMTLLSDFDLIPQIMSIDLRFTALQQNRGTITINPRPGFNDMLCLVSDPDYKRMKRYFKHGKQITYPYLYMIENRMRLQQLIREFITYFDDRGDTLNSLLTQGYKLKDLRPTHRRSQNQLTVNNNHKLNKLNHVRRNSL